MSFNWWGIISKTLKKERKKKKKKKKRLEMEWNGVKASTPCAVYLREDMKFLTDPEQNLLFYLYLKWNLGIYHIYISPDKWNVFH